MLGRKKPGPYDKLIKDYGSASLFDSGNPMTFGGGGPMTMGINPDPLMRGGSFGGENLKGGINFSKGGKTSSPTTDEQKEKGLSKDDENLIKLGSG